MNGSTIKYTHESGRVTWGYHWRPAKDPKDPDGKKWLQVTKQGFPTKREAQDALDEAKKAYAAGSLKKAGTHGETFASFFATWMTEYARRHCAPKTAERYEQLGAYAIKHFGDVALTELRPFALEKAFNALLDHGGQVTPSHPNGRPLSPKTVREVAFLTYGVLKKARAWELISENPADFERITLPKPEKKQAAIVEKEAFRAFIDRARTTRLFPLLVLAAATGARRGELLALQWADINFETGLMLVTKSLEETKAGLRIKCTKGERPRQFIVPRAALEVLEQLKIEQARDKELFGADYEDVDLIFCRPEGGYLRPDKVSVRVTELARKCGLKGVGIHSLRHTHASELLSKGVPIAVVAERLGHRNSNVTLSIYAHALKADERAAAKVWEDAMADVIQDGRKKAGAPGVLGLARPKLKKTS
jgi:integrase